MKFDKAISKLPMGTLGHDCSYLTENRLSIRMPEIPLTKPCPDNYTEYREIQTFQNYCKPQRKAKLNEQRKSISGLSIWYTDHLTKMKAIQNYRNSHKQQAIEPYDRQVLFNHASKFYELPKDLKLHSTTSQQPTDPNLDLQNYMDSLKSRQKLLKNFSKRSKAWNKYFEKTIPNWKDLKEGQKEIMPLNEVSTLNEISDMKDKTLLQKLLKLGRGPDIEEMRVLKDMKALNRISDLSTLQNVSDLQNISDLRDILTLKDMSNIKNNSDIKDISAFQDMSVLRESSLLKSDLDANKRKKFAKSNDLSKMISLQKLHPQTKITKRQSDMKYENDFLPKTEHRQSANSTLQLQRKTSLRFSEGQSVRFSNEVETHEPPSYLLPEKKVKEFFKNSKFIQSERQGHINNEILFDKVYGKYLPKSNENQNKIQKKKRQKSNLHKKAIDSSILLHKSRNLNEGPQIKLLENKLKGKKKKLLMEKNKNNKFTRNSIELSINRRNGASLTPAEKSIRPSLLMVTNDTNTFTKKTPFKNVSKGVSRMLVVGENGKRKKGKRSGSCCSNFCDLTNPQKALDRKNINDRKMLVVESSKKPVVESDDIYKRDLLQIPEQRKHEVHRRLVDSILSAVNNARGSQTRNMKYNKI